MSSQPTFAEALGPWVVRWRWPVLILSVALALVVASGASRLAFNNDYRVFFSDDNPQLQAFEELQRTYTKIDNILFTFVPTEGEIFERQVLAAIEETTLDAWQLPFVLRVDSITNYQHTEATEDDLVVADLVEGATDLDAQALARARQIALNEPLLRDFLVSHDGAATGINITFQMPQKSMDETPEAVAAARELAARIEANYPVKVHLTGMVMLNNSFFEMSMRDMGTLIPAMYLVIIIVSYLMLRSLSATIGTILVILLSLMTAMGFAGWSGVELTPPSSAAPTIIMTLAVADSIHILVAMLALMRSARPKSSTQIVITLENLDSVRLRDVAQRGEQWLADNAPALKTIGIGPGIMFAYISERNIRSMLIGTFLAVVLISGILVFALKSSKLGAISLVPNLLPAGLAFGVWGIFVGELNMAVAMVSGMSLGIVVDDTVHFLSKYRRARHEQNLDAPAAVRYAFNSVGRAIVVTSLILIAGFAVLAQSNFGLNSLMALLTAISIAMALLADFLLLPALLIRFDRQPREEAHSMPVEASLAAS